MSDDVFWTNPLATEDKSYGELTSAGVVRAALYSTMRANAPRSTGGAARRAGSSTSPIFSYSGLASSSPTARMASSAGPTKAHIFASVPKKVMHSPARFAAPAKGKLMLRNPAARYKATGFQARPSKSMTAAAASLPLRSLKSPSKMPDNFCYTASELTQVRDQKSCGCCWSVSSTSMIADRVLVQSGYKTRCSLSPVQLMECADYPEGVQAVGCEGNDPFTALNALKSKPVYLRADSKYPRTDYTVSSTAASCDAGNSAGGDEFGVTASEVFMATKEIPSEASDEEKAVIIKENVENMKQTLYNEGPLVVVFAVPDDFKDYDGNTIYQSPAGWSFETSDAWHAVELVGWGKDGASGQEYWVCRNSWGDKWPVQRKKCAGMGFFFIALGKNMCGIEQYAAGVIPKIANQGKAVQSPNDAFPGDGALCVGGGSGGSFLNTRVVGNITLGQVVVGAVVAYVGLYLYKNHRKTGKWL